MTNIQSIAGGFIWMCISALLLFAALEPVDLNKGTAQLATVATAEAAA